MFYFLSHNYKSLLSAGQKAKSDMEDFMSEWGYKNAGLRRTMVRNTILAFFLNLIGVIKCILTITSGDILVLQYPLKKYFSIICRVAQIKGVTLIALVHDLGSQRRKKISIKKEVSRLSRADIIIATNDVMMRWLRDKGLSNCTKSLKIWDYKINMHGIHKRKWTGSPCVMYAGAINKKKNMFLYSWGKVVNNFKVELYGSMPEDRGFTNKTKFSFHGFVRDNELVLNETAHFGLVWDGDSIIKPCGRWGEYLALNTPHKVSLYLQAGLPLIVWKDSAITSFVLEYDIGIAINSLEEINFILKNMTSDKYDVLVNNVLRMKQQITSGYFLKNALSQSILQ